MSGILDWGISVVNTFQSLGNWLLGPSLVLALAGMPEFYIVLIPLVFWCIDTRLGLRISALLLITTAVNLGLKILFTGPRPYWYSSQVKALAAETTFGIPSGHSQVSASVFGGIAATVRRRWFTVLAVALIILVGLSRIYLGMHFPTDVLTGWLIGGIVLAVYLWLEEPVVRAVQGMTTARQIGLAFLASIAVAAPMLLARAALGNWQMPADWMQTALQATPDTPPDPTSIKDAFTLSGLWFGVMAGYAWLRSRGGYTVGGPWVKRIVSFVLGVAVLLALLVALDRIFPRDATPVALALRYVRYAVLGVWITAVAPLLITRLRLNQA